MPRMEPVAAAGLVGFALWELTKAYQSTAPTLGELRHAPSSSVDHRQRLLDADLMVGGLALLAGGFASWLMRSGVPIVITGAGYAWVAGWHHVVMRGVTPDQI